MDGRFQESILVCGYQDDPQPVHSAYDPISIVNQKGKVNQAEDERSGCSNAPHAARGWLGWRERVSSHVTS